MKKAKQIPVFLFLVIALCSFGQTLPIQKSDYSISLKDSLHPFYDVKTCGYGFKNKEGKTIVTASKEIGITNLKEREGKQDYPYFILKKYNDSFSDKAKYGLRDIFGNVLLDFKYNNIWQYNNEIVIFEYEKKYGFMNVRTHEYLMPEMDLIRPLSFQHFNTSVINPFFFLQYRHTGFLIAPGTMQYIPVGKFNVVHALSEEYYIVENIDESEGNVASVKSVVDYYRFFNAPDRGSVDMKANKGIINVNGKLIVPCKHEFYSIYEDSSATYFWSWDNGKVGVYNEQGKTVLPPKYKMVMYEKPNSCYSFNDWNCPCLDLRESKFYDIYRRNNILSPQYVKSTDTLILKYYRGRYLQLHDNIRFLYLQDTVTSKYGLVSFNGRVLLPFEFENVPDIYKKDEEKDEYCFIWRKKGKYGIIDEKGIEIVGFNYDTIYSLDPLKNRRNNNVQPDESFHLKRLPYHYDVYGKYTPDFANDPLPELNFTASWIISQNGEKSMVDLYGQKKLNVPFSKITKRDLLLEGATSRDAVYIIESKNSRKKDIYCVKDKIFIQQCDTLFLANGDVYTISKDTLYHIGLYNYHKEGDHKKKPYEILYKASVISYDKNEKPRKVYGRGGYSDYVIAPSGKIVDQLKAGRETDSAFAYFSPQNTLKWISLKTGKLLQQIDNVSYYGKDYNKSSWVPDTRHCILRTTSGKCGMIDLLTRKFIIDTVYGAIQITNALSSEGKFIDYFWGYMPKSSGKWALMDTTGHLITNCLYNSPDKNVDISNFKIHTYQAGTGNQRKYGLEKTHCEKITDAIYSYSEEFPGLFILHDERNGWYLYNEKKGIQKKGGEKFYSFDTYGDMSATGSPVSSNREKSKEYFLLGKNDKLKIIDKNGDSLSPFLTNWELINNYDLGRFCKNKESIFFQGDTSLITRIVRNIDILYESQSSITDYEIVHYYDNNCFSITTNKCIDNCNDSWSWKRMHQRQVASYALTAAGYEKINLVDLLDINRELKKHLHEQFTNELNKNQKVQYCCDLDYLLEQFENSFYIDNKGIHFMYYQKPEYDYKTDELLMDLFIPYKKIEEYIKKGSLAEAYLLNKSKVAPHFPPGFQKEIIANKLDKNGIQSAYSDGSPDVFCSRIIKKEDDNYYKIEITVKYIGDGLAMLKDKLAEGMKFSFEYSQDIMQMTSSANKNGANFSMWSKPGKNEFKITYRIIAKNITPEDIESINGTFTFIDGNGYRKSIPVPSVKISK